MNPTLHRPGFSALGPPRTFDLVRLIDATGVSGTGKVAEGCVFEDGTTALRWLTKHRSTVLYESAREVLAIHGHGGKTEIRYHPPQFAGESWDNRACSNCAHPWEDHVLDGAAICCSGGCSCCLLEQPEFKPLGARAPSGRGVDAVYNAAIDAAIRLHDQFKQAGRRSEFDAADLEAIKRHP